MWNFITILIGVISSYLCERQTAVATPLKMNFAAKDQQSIQGTCFLFHVPQPNNTTNQCKAIIQKKKRTGMTLKMC
jgi:hypothetical protein